MTGPERTAGPFRQTAYDAIERGREYRRRRAFFAAGGGSTVAAVVVGALVFGLSSFPGSDDGRDGSGPPVAEPSDDPPGVFERKSVTEAEAVRRCGLQLENSGIVKYPGGDGGLEEVDWSKPHKWRINPIDKQTREAQESAERGSLGPYCVTLESFGVHGYSGVGSFEGDGVYSESGRLWRPNGKLATNVAELRFELPDGTVVTQEVVEGKWAVRFAYEIPAGGPIPVTMLAPTATSSRNATHSIATAGATDPWPKSENRPGQPLVISFRV